MVRARPRGHVRIAAQQEGSFCVVSTWDHDEQLSGRVLIAIKAKQEQVGTSPAWKKCIYPIQTAHEWYLRRRRSTHQERNF